MKYYFYCITNKINGKKYIGLTKRNIQVRFNEHIKNALKNHDVNNDYFMPLLNSIRKYGTENFQITLIDEREFSNFEEAEIHEGFLIKENKSFLDESGYNLNYICDGKRMYVKSVRDKIISNNKGVNNPFYGKKHSEETRKKLSESAKKRFKNPTDNPRYGYKYSKDDKEKSRKSMKRFCKPFTVSGKRYESLKHASDELNLSKQTIRFRLHSDTFTDWKYV